MKPEISSSASSQEQSSVRYIPRVERFRSEKSGDASSEHYPQKNEVNVADNDVNSTTILPPPVVTKVGAISNNLSTTSPDDTQISNAPLLAHDDDLIEKEWVDKAKKIIEETRDNPYQREKEVGKLQIDYQKKRYGRDLGSDVA
jgi:hypothetical protein